MDELTVKLSNATLKDLPDSVLRPSFDRSKLSPGIVHIGLGNFHRAHQAWYLHQLMQKGEALDWAIIGAGVRSNDEAQRLRLEAQDYLTTLIELDPEGQSVEVVGSMIGFVPVVEGNGPLIVQMSDPRIRIVALTVTEGGYYINPVTKAFDVDHPDIQHDASNPTIPKTAFGAMVAALKMRRDAGEKPFTGQSCDNLQGNGAILRQTVVSLARLSDPELAVWIDEHCSFPNAMVDCIVPASGPKELALVKDFGIDDGAPVTHENFRQWVIEDNFCNGRPDWDKAGATFSDDVHAFELPTVREALAAGKSIEGLALSEALWARMCEGTREDGSVIEPNDPMWDSLNAAAKAAKDTPTRWLEQEDLYGELGQNTLFIDAFSRWLNQIWEQGSAAALESYLKQ